MGPGFESQRDHLKNACNNHVTGIFFGFGGILNLIQHIQIRPFLHKT